jgi:ABC-type multidrug transport system fused ATPase/permease subunit
MGAMAGEYNTRIETCTHAFTSPSRPLGISGVASFFTFAMFMLSSARQIAKIREAYFAAVLRQDMEFFDGALPGDITARLNDDCLAIQDGISRKIGEFVMAMCQLIAGFVVAFTYGWKLSLVLMAGAPILGAFAVFLFKILGQSEVKALDAYAEANAIAAETLSAVRTVFSFRGERPLAKKYKEKLLVAQTNGIRSGVTTALGGSGMLATMFLMYALGFWYGAQMIADSKEKAIKDFPMPVLDENAFPDLVYFNLSTTFCPVNDDL